MNADDGDITPVSTSLTVADADIADSVGWYYFDEPQIPDGLSGREQLREWFRAEADRRYGHLYGQQVSGVPLYLLNFDSTPIVTRGISDTTMVTTTGLAVADTTNVQELGVDEADLVESDGERLFLLRSDELLVFRANGVDELILQARVRLEMPASRMILHDNRLAIVSDEPSGKFSGGASTTTITVLDVTDATQPALVQKTEISGSLVDLRAVDGQLVVFCARRGFEHAFPKLQAEYPSLPLSAATGTFTSTTWLSIDPMSSVIDVNSSLSSPWLRSPGVYENREQFLARAEERFLDQVLSDFRSFGLDGQRIASGSVARSPNDTTRFGEGKILVLSFDMHADLPGPVDSMTIPGNQNAKVYATTERLYVFSESSHIQTRATLIEFDSETGKLHEAASGTLNGRLLNQFAADEHDGVLRVVMTDIGGWRGGQAVYTLRQKGDSLVVLGRIDGIAPNETVHSVNFQEDQVHFVTFRKVDPLFAVDLSDPANPTMTGELKIPGYSEMLVSIDNEHLLGIGRGAHGGWFAEMQLSLFDVSDPESPVRTHLHSIEGGRSTFTEVTGGRWTNGDGDHHALAFYNDVGLLALPVQSDGLGGGSLFPSGAGGLLLFRVDTQTGIEQVATIEHDAPIRRTVRVGDRLYAVSSASITAHDVTDPATLVDSITIDSAETGDYTRLVAHLSRALAYWSTGTSEPVTTRETALAQLSVAAPRDGSQLALLYSRQPPHTFAHQDQYLDLDAAHSIVDRQPEVSDEFLDDGSWRTDFESIAFALGGR